MIIMQVYLKLTAWFAKTSGFGVVHHPDGDLHNWSANVATAVYNDKINIRK